MYVCVSVCVVGKCVEHCICIEPADTSPNTSLSAPDEIQYSTCFPTHYKWQDHNYTIGSSHFKLHTTSRKTAETVLPKANVILIVLQNFSFNTQSKSIFMEAQRHTHQAMTHTPSNHTKHQFSITQSLLNLISLISLC